MEKAQGFVENGALTVTTAGVAGSPKVQGSYPQSQVMVFMAGTNIPATIYSDDSLTPKANPFTAAINSYFFFYAANGRYDITFSGGGLVAPLTFGDFLLADPYSAGGGVVFSFNGRTGNVVPQTGDYSLQQISGFPYPGNQLEVFRRKGNVPGVVYEFAPATMINFKDFNFPAQSPGGSLVIGANSVTLSPVPLGVNGGNNNSYLYISGGTGAAEAVRIIGGTAVSGTVSGVVIVDCQIAHSGAWTIQSATSGMQEAVNALPANGGRIYVPAGYYPFFATVTIGKNVHIMGDQMRSTYFQIGASAIGFDLRSTTPGFPNCKFEDFGITTLSGVQQTAGGCGFRVGTPTVESNNNVFINISFLFLWDGVLMISSAVDQFYGCEFSACAHSGMVVADAVFLDNNGPYIVACNFTWYEPTPGAFVRGLAGIIINSTGGIECSDCQFAAYKWGVYLDSSGSSGLMISNFDLENTLLGGFYISGSYGRVVIGSGSVSQFGAYAGWIGILINNSAGGGTASSFANINFYQNGSAGDARGVVMTNGGGGYSFNNMMFWGMNISFDLDATSSGATIMGCDFSQSFGGAAVIKAATGSFPLVIGCTAIPVAQLLDSTIGTWNTGSQVFAAGGKSTAGPGTPLIAGGNGTLALRTTSGWIALV